METVRIFAARCHMPSCGVRARVCLYASVWVSDTFVYFVKTNKRIFTFLHRRVGHTILVFPLPKLWQYSDEYPPNGGIECRYDRQKSRFTTNIWLWQRSLLDRRMSSTFRRWCSTYASSVSRDQKRRRATHQ